MATCDALTDSVLPPELRHIDAAHEYRTTPLPHSPAVPRLVDREQGLT